MIVCSKCNTILPDNSLFCNECGTKIEAEYFCFACKAKVRKDSAFCANCGAPQKKKKEKKIKNKKYKKLISFLLALIIIISAISSAVFFIPTKSTKAKTDFIYYFKDNELFITDTNKKDNHIQLTSQMLNFEKDDLPDAMWECSELICLSDDESTIFFPDKQSDESRGINLYYRNLKKLDIPATKIDSSIVDYKVNTSATIVTYEKDKDEQNSSLYQFHIDTAQKDKIADNIYQYYVSDDGNRLIYIDQNGNLYFKEQDKEKLASDISYLNYVANDLSVIYYTKGGSLYKHTIGEDKVKIDSYINNVYIYDSGEIYYTKSKNIEVCLMDYVNDDLKDADSKIILPDEPVYPDPYQYSTAEEYYAAVDRYEEKYEKYEQEYEDYQEKLYRDRCRTSLENETWSYNSSELYFYNGKDNIKICDSANILCRSFEKPVAVYGAYSQPTKNCLKFSDILKKAANDDIIEITSNMISDICWSIDEYYFCTNEISSLLACEDASSFKINDSGSTIYFFNNVSEDTDHGELYVIDVINNTPSVPELYDSDVYRYYTMYIDDKQFLYYKNNKNDHGDMYINKEKIDFDVYVYGDTYNEQQDSLFYFVDYDDTSYSGTLKQLTNRKTVKIADDVAQYSVDKKGKVLYLSDYNIDYYYGGLYEWSNGKARKINDDVHLILTKEDIKNAN